MTGGYVDVLTARTSMGPLWLISGHRRTTAGHEVFDRAADDGESHRAEKARRPDRRAQVLRQCPCDSQAAHSEQTGWPFFS